MKRKRTYQTSHVQQVQVLELLPLLAAGCIIALDVAKQRFVAALATVAGEVVKLFRFDHPTESAAFFGVVEQLRAQLPQDGLRVAMEPTGTYGDALRHQLVRTGVPVVMVSPKRTHDSQELFDGLRSMHDPKSAVLVAKLCAMGLSTAWSEPPTSRVRLRALVEQRRHEQGQAEVCFGRLEGLMARHWPELGQWMDVRAQRSALVLLAKHTSPARVAAEPAQARATLLEASRSRLSREAIDGVLATAPATLGVPMVAEEEALVRTLATQVLAASRRTDEVEALMAELAEEDSGFASLARWMGTYTAAVIVTLVDPRQYANTRQLEKAIGMALCEKSSGEHKGRLSISKRGPALARQVMYMFALRMIQASPVVMAWYKRRRGYSEASKQSAVVAVMRKLTRAMFHVARGATFDATKLFDTRRLDLEAEPSAPAAPRRVPPPRTKPRPYARGHKRAKGGAAATTPA
jgi:transposase